MTCYNLLFLFEIKIQTFSEMIEDKEEMTGMLEIILLIHAIFHGISLHFF